MKTQPDLPANPTFPPLSAAQLEKMCYRLGASLKAGIPITNAWANEAPMVPRRIRGSFDKVYSRLRDGSTLANALFAEPCFPPLLTEMVCVGEETGQLDQAF